MELLRKLSRDVATYFNITDPNRQSSTGNATADIRALAIDLKDSQVHTPTPGQKFSQTQASSKKKSIPIPIDIFTEGKDILENSAFRNWKNCTGKLGADVVGCDAAYQCQHEAVVGGHIAADEGEAPDDNEEAPNDKDEGQVEFDAEADLEMENEI